MLISKTRLSPMCDDAAFLPDDSVTGKDSTFTRGDDVLDNSVSPSRDRVSQR